MRVQHIGSAPSEIFGLVRSIDSRYPHDRVVVHHVQVVKIHQSEVVWLNGSHFGYFLCFGRGVRPLRPIELDEHGYFHYQMQTGDRLVRTGYVKAKLAFAHVYLPNFNGHPFVHLCYEDGASIKDRIIGRA